MCNFPPDKIVKGTQGRTKKTSMQPLLAAGLKVRDHVPQFVEWFEFHLDSAKHLVFCWRKPEYLRWGPEGGSRHSKDVDDLNE